MSFTTRTQRSQRPDEKRAMPAFDHADSECFHREGHEEPEGKTARLKRNPFVLFVSFAVSSHAFAACLFLPPVRLRVDFLLPLSVTSVSSVV